MKSTRILILLLAICPSIIQAQTNTLQVQKLVLDNGFTVYLNEDKTAKNVYGAVVVNAGSKNDPADATGIAHYLEHMLFNGTTSLGTTNYQEEKPFLDSINIYYDLLGATKDELERKKIQTLINNQSIKAASYGISTEFDKLLQGIGASDINAGTSEDATVFFSQFQGEQIEKWLDIYSHIFQNPIFRFFQSELEVVYEEKNIDMDNFYIKIYEDMAKGLFKSHPYGTQTILGSVEHLKNPSLTKMYEYFNTYYVANNMALVLCGNFDAEKAIPLITEKFSVLKSAPVPTLPKYTPSTFDKKEVVKVRYTPVKAVVMGFKTVPRVHPDKAAVEVLSGMVFNDAGTGFLNKLNQKGKLLMVGSFDLTFNNDGAIVFYAVPKLLGQSIKNAEKLVLKQLEEIKKGNFSDTLLTAIKNEVYLNYQRQMEELDERTLSIAIMFTQGGDWKSYLKRADDIQNITREDIIRVARNYFSDNYFSMHSRTGFPPKTVLKKPGFKPIEASKKGESAYAAHFNALPTVNTQPKFLDFENDAALLMLNESNKLYVTPNKVNDLFSLTAVYSVGTDSIKHLALIEDLFKDFHTTNGSPTKTRQEFAFYGITYNASCSNNRLTITFTGPENNFVKALPLINKLLHESMLDDKSIKVLYKNTISARKLEKKDPSILSGVLYSYVQLGKKSPYLKRFASNEIKKVNANDVVNSFMQAIKYNAVWHYTGTADKDTVKKRLQQHLVLANNNMSLPITENTNLPIASNKIYFIHDKRAVQSRIYFLTNSNNYNATAAMDARISAFNQYMSGGFNSIIIQEIREARSLAYTADGSVVKSRVKGSSSYFRGFIGCQSDKTVDAITAMNDIIHNVPQRPERIEWLKASLNNNISSHYPEFRDVSTTIEAYREAGYQRNPLKAEYAEYDNLSFADVMEFYETSIKGKPLAITIYGNKNNIDMEKLKRFGEVVELKIEDIMKF